MIRIYTLLVLFAISSINLIGQERYLENVFENVDVEMDIQYASNISVITVPVTGSPSNLPLTMDVYTPAGDTETNRPLITLYHTGNFLPIIVNGQVSGTTRDVYIVDLATRLSKLGYVVAVPNYRKGWDPLNTVQEVRTNTLINASYRGVQDSRTVARFFRRSVAEEGNPYGINPDKIVIWGAGTGSYVALGSATIDAYLDIATLPKFIGSDVNGDGNPDPMVIEAVNGDADGLLAAPLNIPNVPGYDSDFQLCVNMGGALGDLTWLDESDPPIISYHVPTDPFAPYKTGTLIVPTTGDLVVEVSGSYDVHQAISNTGINDVFEAGVFNDAWTDAAAVNNDGFPGLFPMVRPDWQDPATGEFNSLEAGPWETWDADLWAMSQPQQCVDNAVPLAACNWHLVSLGANPDMSLDKGALYMDSIVGFFGPRACLALDLGCAQLFVSSEEVPVDYNISLSPNPVNVQLEISTGINEMTSVQIMDMNGRLINEFNNVQTNSLKVNTTNFSKGMYVAQIRFKEGFKAMKFVVN